MDRFVLKTTNKNETIIFRFFEKKTFDFENDPLLRTVYDDPSLTNVNNDPSLKILNNLFKRKYFFFVRKHKVSKH